MHTQIHVSNLLTYKRPQLSIEWFVTKPNLSILPQPLISSLIINLTQFNI